MKQIVILFSSIVCLSGALRLTAQTYNTQEAAKLKAFLTQNSAEKGKKNYEQLGVAPLDAIDWKNVPGLKWNANGRVESINWKEKKLGGDLDVSGFTDLLVIHCERNQLQSLNVAGNTKMTYLDCFNNEFKSIDISTNINLTHFCCRYNQLTKLDVTHNPKLTFLCSSGNRFEQIDLSNNPELVEFYAANGKLKSIDLSHNPKLKDVALRTNQLTSLDVSNLTKLESLTCYENKLTTFNASSCKSLKLIRAYENKITSLDVSGCTALNTLAFYSNKIEELDVSGCPNIEFISLMNNGTHTLKLPPNPSNKLRIMCERNCFTFSTLPRPAFLSSYAPQAKVKLSAPSDKIDLKSEYKMNGTTSVFVWTDKGAPVIPEANRDGLFSFAESYVGKTLTCTVTNPTYPKLTMTYEVSLTEPVANVSVEPEVSFRTQREQLCLTATRPVTVHIYTIIGALLRKQSLSEGETCFTLPQGIYIVSLSNGTVRKIVIS
ncbi:MAG: hypothetical protein ACTTKI_12005 [Tannerella sp.]|uniref:hypothetical protein n=1 Tax=Tannerella sp. TaxID=2382127 RepID=UPI003FA30584